jgi:hypothetical protein
MLKGMRISAAHLLWYDLLTWRTRMLVDLAQANAKDRHRMEER